MPISLDDLYTRVLVRRRVAGGPAPFTWEVVGVNPSTPVFISTDRFGSMEAAYSAGREWIAKTSRSSETKDQRPRRRPKEDNLADEALWAGPVSKAA